MANFVNVGNDEGLDDELFQEYNNIEVDDDRSGEDDSEFLGRIIGNGVRSINNILGGNRGIGGGIRGAIGQVLGVNTSTVSTSGIQGSSNLSGLIQTDTGKQIPFKLPPDIATKQDIEVLRGAISKINSEIKSVADAGNSNANALSKLSKETKLIDAKHIKATRTQNTFISKIGSSVDKLEKSLKETKSQAQMQMMMSMMMQPKLTSLKFTTGGSITAGAPMAVTPSYSGNNDMLMMMMAMGGMGGDGGSDSNMMNNPMMLMLLMGK